MIPWPNMQRALLPAFRTAEPRMRTRQPTGAFQARRPALAGECAAHRSSVEHGLMAALALNLDPHPMPDAVFEAADDAGTHRRHRHPLAESRQALCSAFVPRYDQRMTSRTTPQCFVIDPTPEDLRAMDDACLLDVYAAVVEFDASGGRVRRMLRREIERRRKESQ